MSIGEMQACLARLYVDDSFRRLFQLDPVGTLEQYRLTPQENAALQGIDRAMLDFFSASLKSKRRKRVERAFPLLFMLDRATVNRYYARFYQLHTAKPHQPSHQDALDFGAFLEAAAAGAEDLPPFTADLVRFERLYFTAAFVPAAAAPAGPGEASGNGRFARDNAKPAVRDGVQIAHFTYNVAAIENALQEGRAPECTIEQGGYSIVFRPPTPDSEAKILHVNAPTRVVLELCDGRRTIPMIVAAAESTLRADHLAEAVAATIDRLLSLEILTLTVGVAPSAAVRRSRAAEPSESM